MNVTRHLAVALAALAVGATAVAGYVSSRPHAAPDVAFVRMDGSPAHLAQFKGKVVLVNFWATDCPICLKDMPQMVATHQQFSADGYVTLAVAMRYNPPAAVIQYTEAQHLPFIVVIDNMGAVARSFGGVEGTPTAVLINKRGEIVKRYVGEPDFAELRGRVQKLLNEA